VFIAVAGYTFGGKYFDRLPVIAELQAALPSLEQVIVIGDKVAEGQRSKVTLQPCNLAALQPCNLLPWSDALTVAPPAEIVFEQVPFDHPLWVLYSSGTTGLPKPIVQGHGGILLEHAKVTRLHSDLKSGDRYFWYSSICTGFVGGIRTQPLYAGEIQGPYLGVKVQAWNDAGQPVLDELGELVVTEPMPSMPLYFWNDANHERYRASYFDLFPGVWRHGDWIKFNERGEGCHHRPVAQPLWFRWHCL
jgi:acyl-coenzyme A synthetase/AMP-(fatty) acid ligase